MKTPDRFKHLRVFGMTLLMTGFMLQPVTALADDSSSDEPVDNRYNVIVVTDSSGSMYDTDPDSLRFEAIELFSDLLASEGNYMGGVSFSTDVNAKQSVKAITSQKDKDAVTNALKNVEAQGWTNTGEALEVSIDDILQNGSKELPSVIVLLSDGNTDMGEESKTKESLDLKADAIQKARDNNIQIYSISLNSNNEADSTEMKQIADATGGTFVEVKDANDLQEVFSTFYNLIYQTSTLELADESFPSSGLIQCSFSVPGIGVEEVNGILYGEIDSINLIKPDGTELQPELKKSGTFSSFKLVDCEPGNWKLEAKGKSGASVKINMIYNSDLNVKASISPEESIINPEDPITITANLYDGKDQKASSKQYAGYSAKVLCFNSLGEEVGSYDMEQDNDCFVLQKKFENGVYKFKVEVEGHNIHKTSNELGPIQVSDDALTEAERNNKAPVAKEAVVTRDINIWPFKDNTTEIDMNEFAADDLDDKLTYQIVSSAFMEGSDYEVAPDNVLKIKNISLSKGDFVIKAIDSQGLGTEIKLVIKRHDIGMMTLIGIGVIILLVLIGFGIAAWKLSQKRFGGTITVTSISPSGQKRSEVTPGRGKSFLSRYSVDYCGFNPKKTWFQATDSSNIEFISDKAFYYNGQTVKKITIQSGRAITVSSSQNAKDHLKISFRSRLQKRR